MQIDLATIAFGSLVGFSLGLTGSGGSILAIPLLVYGAGLTAQEALPISLLMVAAIAAIGALRQSFNGQVDWRATFLFSLAGVLVSPLVVSMTHDVDERIRLGLLALLMFIVAARMAFQRNKPEAPVVNTAQQGPKRDIGRIALGGSFAGAMSGFFGVGGGFIIVPFLILLFAMPYKQAVGTSLASIALISTSALFGFFMEGASFDTVLLAGFMGGGVVGLMIGTMMVNIIPEIAAKRAFALITSVLAVFMIFDKFILQQGGIS